MNSNQKDTKVSVYCLAYNHEKYIRKTLDGFVSQITDFNFEVWVHDDASTDHTPDIIQEYADRYPAIIKPIYQQENQYSKGVGITHTYIYPNMQGKYIASCEGDDYWNDPYKLQKQFVALETHPECSLSTHKVLCCNEDGKLNECVLPADYYHIHETRVIEEKELAQCYFIRGNYPFHTSSYFYRKEIIDIELNYPRDVGVLRKCLVLGSVYFFDEPMSIRRLWSIGNWNSRMKDGGIHAWWKLRITDIVFEDEFDRYTDYLYHDFIRADMLKKFIEFVWCPKYRREAKKILRKYELTPWKVRKVLPINIFLKLEMKYVLAMYFPDCYSGTKKIWLLATGRNRK